MSSPNWNPQETPGRPVGRQPWIVVAAAVVLAAAAWGGLAAVQHHRWKSNHEADEARATQNRVAESEKSFKAAIEIAENFGGNDLRLARSLHGLGAVYKDRFRFAEAEPLPARAVDEKAFGAGSAEVARDILGMGDLHNGQDHWEQAEQNYRQALGIQEKTVGPGHPMTATTVQRIASLKRRQKKFAEAEELYRRCIAMREKALGPEHFETIFTVHGLALNCENQASTPRPSRSSSAPSPGTKKPSARTT